MELRRLEQFVAVAEQRNFTRAAQRLHMGQSALSVSVKTLERELGAPLFVRTTHRVELTDAGAALLPEARATLAAAEAARDAVVAVRGGLRGTLRLGIIQSHGIFDLAELITRFHRERPAVEILPRPTREGSAALLRDVASGELDLAFASGAGSSPSGLRLVPVATVALELAVQHDHPLAARPSVSVEDLRGMPFVEAPEGWGNRTLTDRAFARAGVEREVAVEVGDISTIVELVRAGLALGFVPRTAQLGTAGLRLIPLDPPLLLDISLAVPLTRRPTAAARAFAALVQGRCEAFAPLPAADTR
ncbi:LysR family transcriptional regulator [Streptomyces sp. NPDC058417]|uniref:LysR family transcriptional regulator n=1 Tax=unclassified Streptomyces TaxID=2593676 RepID=UPI00365FE8AC